MLRRFVILVVFCAFGFLTGPGAVLAQSPIDLTEASLQRLLADHSQEPLLHFEDGLRLAAAEQLEPALAAFSVAARLRPGFAAAHFDRAVLLSRLGREREAQVALRTCLRLVPDDAEAHFLLGLTYHRSQDLLRAQASYERALRHDRALFPAWSNLARVHFEEGRRDEAVAAWRQAVRLRPSATWTHWQQALTAGVDDRDVVCAQAAEEALRLSPPVEGEWLEQIELIPAIRRSDPGLAARLSARCPLAEVPLRVATAEPRQRPEPALRRRVLVLPFAERGAGPVATGLVEKAVATELGRRGCYVVPPALLADALAGERYRPTLLPSSETVVALAARFGADLVVSGEILEYRQEERVRLAGAAATALFPSGVTAYGKVTLSARVHDREGRTLWAKTGSACRKNQLLAAVRGHQHLLGEALPAAVTDLFASFTGQTWPLPDSRLTWF